MYFAQAIAAYAQIDKLARKKRGCYIYATSTTTSPWLSRNVTSKEVNYSQVYTSL